MPRLTNLLWRLRSKWTIWLITFLALPSLYGLDFYLAPQWFVLKLEDFGPRELAILQGREELVLEGLSIPEKLPVLFFGTRGKSDLEVKFAKAKLANTDASFQTIRHFSLPTLHTSNSPCRTNLSLHIDDLAKGMLPTLHLSQAERARVDFRLIQLQFPGKGVKASIKVGAQWNAAAVGPGCRKQLWIGDKDADSPASLMVEVAAGSDIDINIKPLSISAPSTVITRDLWPVDLFGQAQVRAVKIVGISDPRNRTVAASWDGKPTISVENIRLGTDRIQVSIDGKGSISGTQAPSLSESLRSRPRILAMILILLANGCGVILLAMSLRTAWGHEEPQEFPDVQKGLPVRIFVSYSHDDLAYMKEILGFLKGLEREGVELWTDKALVGGDHWQKVILDQIEASDMVLALVSQSFLDSKFCTDVEVRGFLAKSAILVPVILSPCLWRDHPWLTCHHALPNEKETLDHYQEPVSRKQLLVELRQHLLTQVAKVRQERQEKGRKRRWLRVLPPFLRRRPAKAA